VPRDLDRGGAAAALLTTISAMPLGAAPALTETDVLLEQTSALTA
jgi:hypothetical protein